MLKYCFVCLLIKLNSSEHACTFYIIYIPEPSPLDSGLKSEAGLVPQSELQLTPKIIEEDEDKDEDDDEPIPHVEKYGTRQDATLQEAKKLGFVQKEKENEEERFVRRSLVSLDADDVVKFQKPQLSSSKRLLNDIMYPKIDENYKETVEYSVFFLL